MSKMSEKSKHGHPNVCICLCSGYNVWIAEAGSFILLTEKDSCLCSFSLNIDREKWYGIALSEVPWLAFSVIINGRNEVVAKVMFLLVSVILLTGGCVCLSACWDTTPPSRHLPGSRHPPEQTTPGSRHPPGSRLRHTVNERLVHILLECILVFVCFS